MEKKPLTDEERAEIIHKALYEEHSEERQQLLKAWAEREKERLRGTNLEARILGKDK